MKPEIKKLLFLKTFTKTNRFYFGNLLYILIINALYVFFLADFFVQKLMVYVVPHLSISIKMIELFIFSLMIAFFCLIKIVFYTHSTEAMNKGIPNDILVLLISLFTRFFVVFGTFVIVLGLSIFSFFILIIPGILCVVYNYSTLVISSIREKKDGNIMGARMMMGPSAIARSYTIVRGNFFRVVFFTFLAVGFIVCVAEGFCFIANSLEINSDIVRLIKFSLYDFIIIFNIVVTFKLEKLEDDSIKEKTRFFDPEYVFRRG